MSLITVMEIKILDNCKHDYQYFLSLEKFLVEQCFDWIYLVLNGKMLIGKGVLEIANKAYFVNLMYSPFFSHRFDRIFIKDDSIRYDKAIHLYKGDMSLCLYHPIIDKPKNEIIPLYRMIPWISEWCIFYEEWKKYGVWLGRQIEH